MPDVHVQTMTSWGRTSPNADGTMGGGVALTKPGGCSFTGGRHPCQAHVPAPGVRVHTHALLLNVIFVLKQIPKDKSIEIELTHQFLVETIKKYPDARSFIDFVRAEVFTDNDFVPKKVVDELEELWVKRTKPLTFRMCVDAGRYMTKEVNGLFPPGVAARKRLDAVKNKLCGFFRGATDDSDDLLEVRFAADPRDNNEWSLYQERFRDFILLEMASLKDWASKLSQDLFSMENLAEDNPGVFWSCVRYGGDLMFCKDGVVETDKMQKGRDSVMKAIKEILQDYPKEVTWDFPGQHYIDIGVVSAIKALGAAAEYYGLKGGQGGRILSNENDKGSEFEKKMYGMITGIRNNPEKVLQQLDKEDQDPRQRGPQAQLFGQSLCCFGCGNVEEQRVPFLQCKCGLAHFCMHCVNRETVIKEHQLECPKNVGQMEPESEETDTHHVPHVECLVLPLDKRVKPYSRWLPTEGSKAIPRLKELLTRGIGSCKDHVTDPDGGHDVRLIAGIPERGFMNGVTDDGRPRAGIYLIQADFSRPFVDKKVTVQYLQSAAGRRLNGQKGVVEEYVSQQCRYRVKLEGADKTRLIKGENLVPVLQPKLPPQNKRASTILTPLDFSNAEKMNTVVAMPENPGDMTDAQVAEYKARLQAEGRNMNLNLEPVMGVRARGDVYVIRIDHPTDSALPLDAKSTLKPFTFQDYQDLWGVFQYMPMPVMPFFMGTIMKSSEAVNLGRMMRQAFYGDEMDSAVEGTFFPTRLYTDMSDAEDEEWWNFQDQPEYDEEPDPLVGSYVEVAITEKTTQKVHGLEKAAQYNGQIGFVQKHIPAKGNDEDRFEVNLMEVKKVLAIKRKNMIRESRPRPTPSGYANITNSFNKLTVSETEREPDSECCDEKVPPRSERFAQAPVGSKFFVKPSELMFWTDEISTTMGGGQTIQQAFHDLKSKNTSASSSTPEARKIGLIHVVSYEGRLHALSGRRLALYRLLEQNGSITQVKVKVVMMSKTKKERTFEGAGEVVRIQGTDQIIGTSAATTTFKCD